MKNLAPPHVQMMSYSLLLLPTLRLLGLVLTACSIFRQHNEGLTSRSPPGGDYWLVSICSFDSICSNIRYSNIYITMIILI